MRFQYALSLLSVFVLLTLSGCSDGSISPQGGESPQIKPEVCDEISRRILSQNGENHQNLSVETASILMNHVGINQINSAAFCLDQKLSLYCEQSKACTVNEK